MTLLLLLTVLLTLLASSEGYLIGPGCARMASKMQKISFGLIAASAVLSAPMPHVLVSPAFADDVTDVSMAPAEINMSKEDEAARIQRKLAKQRAMSGQGDDKRNENKSYAESLKKEKAKQDAAKKTKAQRARDLCETLGRGC
jgi:hypothetical protein